MIRKGRRIPPVIPLASMADIAFLLIVFFLLASSFTQQSDAPVQRAKSPDIASTESMRIGLVLDSLGQLRLQGRSVTVVNLQAELEVVLQDRQNRKVHVTIDKDLTKKTYYPVLQILGRAGATPVLTGDIEK